MASEAPELHEGHLPAARCWYAKPDGRLMSTVVNYVWTGPVERNEAPPAEDPWERLDSLEEYQVPPKDERWRGPVGLLRDDSWGFYACTVKDARRWLSNELRVMQNSRDIERVELPPVVGRVSLFGTVWVHDHGYRAQGVQIERLAVLTVERARYVIDDWEELREQMEGRFRCSVELREP